jgi:hypothetical protein
MLNLKELKSHVACTCDETGGIHGWVADSLPAFHSNRLAYFGQTLRYEVALSIMWVGDKLRCSLNASRRDINVRYLL